MDKIEEICRAIQIKEGWYLPDAERPNGSVSWRCKNPGNILYGDLAKSLGATDKYTSSLGLTYAVWPTEEDGFYALKVFIMLAFSGQLKSYKPEMTLKEFFKVYSGGGETYGAFVASKTGLQETEKVKYIYDEFWDKNHATGEFPTEYYHQRSDRYKGKKLGNSSTSMQTCGCALMCWSYVSKRDPLEVNQLFIDKGVYSGDKIVFEKACSVLGFKNYEKSTDINRMPDQEETIKEVSLGKSQHFTIRINKDGKRTIYDPWLGEVLSINYYNFRSYRIFDK